MNLQQTIDQLEQQAQQYRQAAEQLRTLTTGGASGANGVPTSEGASELSDGDTVTGPAATKKSAAKRSTASGKGAGKPGKARATRIVSDETRAKISEKLKAAHAARKAAAASSASV